MKSSTRKHRLSSRGRRGGRGIRRLLYCSKGRVAATSQMSAPEPFCRGPPPRDDPACTGLPVASWSPGRAHPSNNKQNKKYFHPAARPKSFLEVFGNLCYDRQGTKQSEKHQISNRMLDCRQPSLGSDRTIPLRLPTPRLPRTLSFQRLLRRHFRWMVGWQHFPSNGPTAKYV